MKESLGELIRKLREEKELPLRKVAYLLDIDQSTLSKIERGDRLPTKELLPKIAEVFGLDEKAVLISLLGDKVVYPLMEEAYQEEVLEAAEQKLKYLKSKMYEQGQLKL